MRTDYGDIIDATETCFFWGGLLVVVAVVVGCFLLCLLIALIEYGDTS